MNPEHRPQGFVQDITAESRREYDEFSVFHTARGPALSVAAQAAVLPVRGGLRFDRAQFGRFLRLWWPFLLGAVGWWLYADAVLHALPPGWAAGLPVAVKGQFVVGGLLTLLSIPAATAVAWRAAAAQRASSEASP